MNIHRRRLLAALVASAALCAPLPALAQSAAIAAPALEGRALVTALRGGGYVLYLRHTSTDFGENDAGMTDYQDCATQRNLTDKGRAEARAIGAALRELRIPIGDVLASPYCRTMETGRLVFGSATATPAVRGGPARPDNADRYADLRRVLGTAPPPGTNVAIASHGNPFFGVAGAPYLAEGEIAVVQPQGGELFRIVARVRWDAWAALAGTR
jgi:phosphohistidine phosphatase SixA